MEKRRVVVTGIGLITPFGVGKERFWQAVKEGRSGIKKIQRFDPSPFKSQMAGECRDFDPLQFLDAKEVYRMDRVSHLAVAATSLAMHDSGLKTNSHKAGVILGTGLGGITTDDEQHKILHTKGHRFVKPMAIPMIMYNAAASHISMRFGLKGPGYTISTACTSGAQAIGEAYRMIKHAYAEAMIAGGSDAPLSFGIFSAWCALRVLSTRNAEPEKACRPFSKDRDGMVLAEGAGIVVLEELRHALKRSAPIYGEIIGYGITNDAYHLTYPRLEGEIKAMKRAIEDASISADEVDYINAHGTATPVNDLVETKAIKKVFANRAYSIPVSSTKSMIGHAMGASGAIEFITCCLSIGHDLIPPTINYITPDPKCDLDYVPNMPRKKIVDIAISDSFGFGGNNAVLISKRYNMAV